MVTRYVVLSKVYFTVTFKNRRREQLEEVSIFKDKIVTQQISKSFISNRKLINPIKKF